jgi:hypothetical protein
MIWISNIICPDLFLCSVNWGEMWLFVLLKDCQHNRQKTTLIYKTLHKKTGVEFTCSGRVGSPCTTRCTHRATLEDTNGSKSNPENGQKIQLPSQRKSRLREKWKLGKEEPITNKYRWSYIQFFVVCVLRNTIHYKFACRNQIVSQIYNTLQYVVCNYI